MVWLKQSRECTTSTGHKIEQDPQTYQYYSGIGTDVRIILDASIMSVIENATPNKFDLYVMAGEDTCYFVRFYHVDLLN